MEESFDRERDREDERAPRSGDPVEELVAECLERMEEEGDAALAAMTAAHPEHAGEIRRRIDALAHVGLGSRSIGAGGSRALPGVFGRYRIVARLGEGGMGVVYLAHDAVRGTDVALKVGVRLHGDARARARFEREVRVASRLAHPRIVPIFDCGEENGVPYFTMQYVEGATLARVISSLRERGLAYDELTPAHVQAVATAGTTRAGSSASFAAPVESSDGWGKTYVERSSSFMSP